MPATIVMTCFIIPIVNVFFVMISFHTNI